MLRLLYLSQWRIQRKISLGGISISTNVLNTPLAMVCNLFTLDAQYKPLFKHKLKTYQIWPNVLAFL